MPNRNAQHYGDLIRQNLDLLNQAIVLLDRLPEHAYTKECTGGQRVGAQMRHVLEFYDCFLAGWDAGAVDYAARKRDERLAMCTQSASHHARALVEAIASHAGTANGVGRVLSVRAESGDLFVASVAERELQSLISHTTHHFALISLLLQWQGIAVEREFGVSQSTLQYWETVAA